MHIFHYNLQFVEKVYFLFKRQKFLVKLLFKEVCGERGGAP